MGKQKDCSICYTNFIKFKNPACGHSCCYDCLVNWIQEKIQYQKVMCIPCITTNCKNKIHIPKTYSKLPEQYKSQLEPLYLSLMNPSFESPKPKENKCLCTEEKTSNCDNINCKFNPEKVIKNSLYSHFKKLLKEITNQKNEFLTEKWKQLFTKPCPNCNVSIEKEDGCIHMTCIACNYEYCWVCGSPYPFHLAFSHQIRIFLSVSFLLLLAILFVFLLYWIFQITILKFLLEKYRVILEYLSMGLEWLFFSLWRYGVGLLFLSHFYLKNKKDSRFVLALCLGVTHFWGGYSQMIKIVLGEVLVICATKGTLTLWRGYKKKRLRSTVKERISSCFNLQNTLVVLAIIFVVVQIFSFQMRLNGPKDIELKI